MLASFMGIGLEVGGTLQRCDVAGAPAMLPLADDNNVQEPRSTSAEVSTRPLASPLRPTHARRERDRLAAFAPEGPAVARKRWAGRSSLARVDRADSSA